MSISSTSEARILALIFQAVAWSRYADNASIAAEVNIAVALHTADPTDAGTMSSSPLHPHRYGCGFGSRSIRRTSSVVRISPMKNSRVGTL